MSHSQPPASGNLASKALRSAQVIVVSSVMFTFISYWRTAAVVLCDLASTAYYIGGIVEQSVGKAAPWFILAVMLFSYCVRSVYIESCSLFVRGGVYRVVKEAMGGLLAKLSVSALMFDYILTGPISGVSAGQYIIGLFVATTESVVGHKIDPATVDLLKHWGSVAIAIAITLYFYWQNVKGIHESSEKALKIMMATTVMGVIMLIWCGTTLLIEGPKNSVPMAPNLAPKPTAEGMGESPLGFLDHTQVGDKIEGLGHPGGPNWLSIIGFLGVSIAFGHSILALSGEETLAQVYREVESPKMKNFRKAAFVVFVYSLLLTGGISFLAVMLIPDDVRMSQYADNLIGGLAMNVYGPMPAKLLLNAFVVVIGFLILAGAVNTAIIGSNGVLNRVSEDGVLPDWFLKPHQKYGTTTRLLNVILVMQLFTIVASRGDVLLLGEAYAFGVVWSFVFKALAMVVLRFRGDHQRDYKVPFNLRIGKIELPLGLIAIFLVLLVSAIMNLLTKTIATKWGLGFTAAFLTVFIVTEWYHERRRKSQGHEAHPAHVEQFNEAVTPDITAEQLGITAPYRRLVAIRSKFNLFMLEKTLAETDPQNTAVVVMTAKVKQPGDDSSLGAAMESYDQELMTAVVERAEKAGKPVIPLIVPTNNGLYAVLRTAKDIGAQEVVMGLSNKYTADDQFDQIAFYWLNLHGGESCPLTVRILSADRDLHLDLAGGSRIPRMSAREAHSVADLRAAGVGIDRTLFIHDGTGASSDLFEAILTMLDGQVRLDVVSVHKHLSPSGQDMSLHDVEQAQRLGRTVSHQSLNGELPAGGCGQYLVAQLHEHQHDAVFLLAEPGEAAENVDQWRVLVDYVSLHAHCVVFRATRPAAELQVHA